MKSKNNTQIHESVDKENVSFLRNKQQQAKYLAAVILIIGAGFVIKSTFAASRKSVRFSLSNSSTDTGVAFGAPSTSDPKPTGVAGNWTLKFSDDFNGTTLDTSKWTKNWFGDPSTYSKPVNSSAGNCFSADQISVSNGNLNMGLANNTASGCTLRDGTTMAKYKGGLVNTLKKYEFSYGFMEARMYVPGANGLMYNWATFWSDTTGDWPEGGEIDVMESLSDRYPNWHYHYAKNGVEAGPGGGIKMDGTGWHTYAAKWEPTKITWYYDGVEVASWTDGIVPGPHFVILEHGVNKSDTAPRPDTTAMVDYVRVWQQ